MADAEVPTGRKVVDFATYRRGRRDGAITAPAMRALCRHCGAALGEGESEDECSSAGISAATLMPSMPRRKFRAE